ncbi:hypothetical protein NESM_000201200 [Novymonas esmeraldas]|uniref:Uncharacterized protein n=1 Tax=Novymonas esmeraldas TaxID=1808958 RepID=A0AAW0F9X1_9TRYP
MSCAYAGVPRSERLLPLESTEVLRLTESFTVHVLHHHHDDDGGDGNNFKSASDGRGDAEDSVRLDKRLHDHVSVYWDQQKAHRTYQQRLLHDVGSSRGPVRFAGFPLLKETAAAPPKQQQQQQPQQPSSPDTAAASAVNTVPPPLAGVVPPPRSLAAWSWIALVAPYERLLCPSLLYSALLSPSVGDSTPLCYGVQPPSPASPTSVSTAGVRACWSAHTCHTLWALHTVAAEASLPVQEVYVACAGMILYLDTVVTAGRVWSELEGLWGGDLAEEVSAVGVTPAAVRDGDGESIGHATCTPLSSLRASLSQPPSTYAALLQHTRVLMEAIACADFPRPLTPWLEAAMERDEWTTTAAAAAASSGATEPRGSGGGNTDAELGGFSGSVAEHTLKHAVAVWLARRGATVTAATPTGSRAVALPPRDLCASRGSNPSASPGHHRAPGSASVGLSRASAAGTPGRSAGTTPIVFEAFEPHDAPREQHPFLLPPLPQDPALLAFAVVWRRTLRRCVMEPDVLRQRLRQVILGYVGERCDELLRDSAPPATCAGPASPALPSVLTSDPTTTSFCVWGPRLGVWLTSSRSGGWWGGFRGELVRCVAPPVVPPLSSSGTAAAPLRRRPPHSSSATARTPATGAAAPAEPVTEVFVDGALEVDGTRVSPTAAAALYSAEELADRLCRLGAAVPRYATEVSGDRLRPADAAYVREVLQRHCLPLLLTCQRRGIQQWGLRAWMKGITLTLLDNSGTESRVVTPPRLAQLGLQEARSAGGGDELATAAALRLVMSGGLSESLAFVEHVQKRGGHTVRWLPVRRVSSDHSPVGNGSDGSSAVASASSHAPAVAVVEALLLRRVEESALFRIFQSHARALQLTGCGVRRLALPPAAGAVGRSYGGGSGGHPRVSAASTLLLERTCGVVVEWDLHDCYEGPKLSRLRAPRCLTSQPRRGGSSSSLPLPPDLGAAAERVSLRHVRGMLQHYLRSIDSTAAGGADVAIGAKRWRAEAGDAAGSNVCAPAEPLVADDVSELCQQRDESIRDAVRPPPPPRTTLFPIDRAVILYVLRHHPQYHQHVAGCGVKDVYVGAVNTPAAAAAAPTATASRAAAVVVVVERVCGQVVEVDVEECYDKEHEGKPLHPVMILA